MIPLEKEKKKLQSFRDLEVYQTGFELSMQVFKMTGRFPKDEQYSLVTQMRNAARSIPANIAEGWAKRRYPAVFKRHIMDALGSSNEMLVWLDTSNACGYIVEDDYVRLAQNYELLAKRLYHLHANWRSF